MHKLAIAFFWTTAAIAIAFTAMAFIGFANAMDMDEVIDQLKSRPN
jgi:hypothetical protein